MQRWREQPQLPPEANVQFGEFERYCIEQKRPQALQNLGHALSVAFRLRRPSR